MQTAAMRERLYTIRMSEDETTRLDALSAHYGLTAAGVIRMLLKRDADTVLVDAKAPAKKPTTKQKK